MARRLPASRITLVFAGIAAMGLASRIEIPMAPVPLTMQTFAVAVMAVLFGALLASVTLAAWLILGAAGLPLFAGGASGVEHLTGATAGYLLAFPLAAMLMGWPAGRADEVSLARLFGIMLLGHAVCLALGGAWLAAVIGAERAIAVGVTPFLLGAAIKSALGAVTVRALNMLLAHRAKPSARAG